MSFDNIRDAFAARGDIKPRGAGFTASCPAHDDANASLSCEPGADGRTVVKCYVGCSWAAIVAALGLPKSEWFPPKPARSDGRPLISEWIIRDAAGKALALHRKYRKPDGGKSFEWYWPDGSVSRKPNGVDTKALPLYGVHRLTSAEPVVLCEGEKDADAAHAAGLNALGTVCGAGTIPCDEALSVLAGRHVVLWPDNDDGGRTHMQRIAGRIKAASIRVASDAAAPPKGGAADARDPASVVAAAVAYAPTPAAPEVDEPHTDLGVARRFISSFGGDFRYVAGQWFRWDGSRWAPDNAGLVLHTMASVARSVSVAAGGDEITAKAARKQESSSRVNGATGLAAVDPRIVAPGFDAIPYLLACRNATVDLRTGTAVSPRRDDRLSRAVPHDFDPAAKCPRWERFILEVCAERVDLAAFLRRFLGYVTTGEVTEHALMLATGKGRNGKSTLVETVMHVLGDELAGPAPPGLLIATKNERHPTEIMDLRGRRLVVASEVPKHGTFSEERVKWLTGGDAVKARAMRQDFVAFRPTHKFILLANHLPTVKDPTEGFWRRVRVVPFDVDFRGREDHSLVETLRSEARGILAWLVRAAVDWRSVGLGETPAVSAATADYRQDEDVLGRFLAQWDGGDETTGAAIFAAFKAWSEREGEPEPRSAKVLAADLAALGWTRRRTKAGSFWRRPEPPQPPQTASEPEPPPPQDWDEYVDRE